MMLNGVRIVDFSQYIPGSYATLRLAEMGAEIIKVEPLTGDPARSFGKEKDATGVVFEANNRGKRSITINLKKEEGQAIARKLVKTADVIIEGFRPGVMEKFQLNYEKVKEINDSIIYLSLSGYGQDGTMHNFGSHDLNYLSLSGVLSQVKDRNGKPILPRLTFADIIGGMTASEKVIAALFQKERTGKGQFINLSLMDSIFSLMNINIYTERKTGHENVISQLDGELISYNIYQTKDNRYVSLAALELKFWENFCHAVGHEEWIPSHLTLQNENNQVFHQLSNLFKSKTLEEWSHFSMEVDCCLTPILEVNELNSHPYIKEKELVQEGGTAPRLGEQTEIILKKMLNMNQREIEELRRNNVI